MGPYSKVMGREREKKNCGPGILLLLGSRVGPRVLWGSFFIDEFKM